ncbi:MAG TPA: trypsin-like peptidase domain-containing protein, partial [Gemmatimonadales bacterium]|nr:trypsin-like peptidase domain-containing protein [Gemmatimonadales bacterium]
TVRAPEAFTSPLGLGPVDPGALEALRAANASNQAKRLEVGIGRDTGAASATWVAVQGGMAARWRVRSEGAASLRVALRAPSWPEDAELRFAGNGDGVVYGPYSGAQARSAGAAYWSPVLEGDSATVEVFVPRGSPLPELDVARVSHLFVSFAAAKADIVAKVAQPCQVNIICRAASEPALADAGRAVARIAFTTASGGSAFCTGTLLNSTGGGLTPYFATAGHCISAPSEAASVTTRWNYETATCTGTALNTADTAVGGGATLLYTNTTEDFTLMRLNGSPPAGAVFSGWNSARLNPGEAATAIHHPTGDVKKVSLGTAAGVGKSVVADGNGFRIQWAGTSTGFTEPGSSGSGIFSGNASEGYRFRGTLQGGPIVTCSAPVSQLYDYYSRFDLNFPFVAQFLSTPLTLGANAVSNPGFESGAASWSESPAGSIITNDASLARSGSWYAWLGGANNFQDAVTGSLAVPAGAARLQFWYRIAT